MRKRQDGRSADRGGVENGQGHSFFSRCPRLAPVVEGFHALPTPQVGTNPKGKLAHRRQVHWHVRQTRDLDLRNYPVRQSFTCKSVAGPRRSRTAHLDLFSLMRLHRQGPRLARQSQGHFHMSAVALPKSSNPGLAWRHYVSFWPDYRAILGRPACMSDMCL